MNLLEFSYIKSPKINDGKKWNISRSKTAKLSILFLFQPTSRHHEFDENFFSWPRKLLREKKKKDRNCNKFLDSSWQVGQKTLLKALKASLMTFANSNMKSSSKMSHFSDLIQIRISYQKISVLSFEAYVVMVATSFLHSHPKFSDIVSVPKVWICDLWLLLQQLLF